MSKYESIQYMNVYFKRYDDIAPSDVGKCIEEFYRLFRNAGLIADGNLIYALNKIDEEKLSIEFMLCAKESRHKGVKKLTYRSYLMISHMTSVVVKNDYETNMEGAYLQLMKVARNNGMKIISPFYHEIVPRGKKAYCIVKVVVAKLKEKIDCGSEVSA